MGKYNVGYHGPKSDHDLQGVITITHNPLTVENISHEKRYDEAVEELRQYLDMMKQQLADLTSIPKDSNRMKAF